MPLSGSNSSSGFRHSILTRTSHSRSHSSGRSGEREGEAEDSDEIPGDDDPDGPPGEQHEDAWPNTSQHSYSGSMGEPSGSFDMPPSTQPRPFHVMRPPMAGGPPSPPRFGEYQQPPAPPIEPMEPEYAMENLPPVEAASPAASNNSYADPSAEGMKSSSPDKGRRTRVPQACDLCRKRKARCIGGRPVGTNNPNDPGAKCVRCTKQSADCQWSFFSDSGRQATTAKKKGRVNGTVIAGEKRAQRSALQQQPARQQQHSSKPYQGQHEDIHAYGMPGSSGTSHETTSLAMANVFDAMSPPTTSPPTSASTMPNSSKRARMSPPMGLPPPPPPPPFATYRGGHPDGGDTGRPDSRQSDDQRSLEAAALAREMHPQMAETQSQESQALAMREALEYRLNGGEYELQGNDEMERQRPIVMDLSAPSAASSSSYGQDGQHRNVPAPRTIVLDGMGGGKKRKNREEEPHQQNEFASAPANQFMVPDEPAANMFATKQEPDVGNGHAEPQQQSHWDLLRHLPRPALEALIRKHQREASLLGDRGVWEDAPEVNSEQAGRRRRASVASGKPLQHAEADTLSWLESNRSQWTVEDGGGPKEQGEDGLPVLKLGAELSTSDARPPVEAQTAPARTGISLSDDPALASTDPLAQLSSQGGGTRLQDVLLTAAHGYAAEPQVVGLSVLGGLQLSADGMTSGYFPASLRQQLLYGNGQAEHQQAFGYEWPIDESSQLPIPVSQQLPASHGGAEGGKTGGGATALRRKAGGPFASDSQINSIFDLDDAGLASQQSQKLAAQAAWPSGSLPGAAAAAAAAAAVSSTTAGGNYDDDQAQMDARHAAALALNDLTQTSDRGVLMNDEREGGGGAAQHGETEGDGNQ